MITDVTGVVTEDVTIVTRVSYPGDDDRYNNGGDNYGDRGEEFITGIELGT